MRGNVSPLRWQPTALLLFAVLANLLWLPQFASAGFAEKTCNDSTVEHDARLIVTFYRARDTGWCYFRVAMPPAERASGLAGEVALAFQNAATDFSDEIARDTISRLFLPAVAEIIRNDIERYSLFESGGKELLDSLADFEEAWTGCAISSIETGFFEFEEGDFFRLNCQFDEEREALVINASNLALTTEIHFPFGQS